MQIHILGICGTFMGGLAVLAKQAGHDVTGSDTQVYPPMSTLLEKAGIKLCEGYEPRHLNPKPDMVIIGNALSRGNPAIEYILNENIPYISGPQWLYEFILKSRHVIAVAGTHGKTTTTSLLAWILEQADLQPGYLIGGAPKNFPFSADLGKAPFFVIEADEYDTAFFDKRSKFMHYHPQTVILNNLEFDHADIFSDLEAIKKQFQYLLRTIPAKGTVIYPSDELALVDVLKRGCWSNQVPIGQLKDTWGTAILEPDGSVFEVFKNHQKMGTVHWNMSGLHNVKNALAAIAAAEQVGVPNERILQAFKTFEGVKRRMECRGEINGITVYDDFAHHPTAIETTVNGLRAKVKEARIFAVLELASNTLKMGANLDQLPAALKAANRVFLLKPSFRNKVLENLLQQIGDKISVFENVAAIINQLVTELKPKDQVLIMSNKGFDGIHQKLLVQLKDTFIGNATLQN